nr:hypothetical protein CFP56_65462 [Quercus suber]
MKDEDGLIPATTAKKETLDSSFFGKGRYKFWALAAILLLAFWSMFTGTVTLCWSAGNLNQFTEDLDNYILVLHQRALFPVTVVRRFSKLRQPIKPKPKPISTVVRSRWKQLYTKTKRRRLI